LFLYSLQVVVLAAKKISGNPSLSISPIATPAPLYRYWYVSTFILSVSTSVLTNDIPLDAAGTLENKAGSESFDGVPDAEFFPSWWHETSRKKATSATHTKSVRRIFILIIIPVSSNYMCHHILSGLLSQCSTGFISVPEVNAAVHAADHCFMRRFAE